MGCGPLLPTYAQIGIAAPSLMLALRLLQGLAIGGELPSMIVYVSESMPTQRSLGMGGVFSGTVCGLIPGMLLNLWITHAFTLTQIQSFGWRIPFALGGVLCFIAYRVRRELHESAAFKKMRHHRLLPFVELLRHHATKVLIGVGLIAIVATPIILAIIFMPTYLVKIVKWNPRQVSDAVLVATLVSTVSIYLMGIIAERGNIYRLAIINLVLIVPAAGLCYYLISIHANLVIALVVFAIFQGFLVTIPPVFLSYLFPIDIRLTGVALSYNISFVVFGGIVPLFVTSLIEKTGWVYLVPVLALLLTVIFAAWGVVKAKPLLVD